MTALSATLSRNLALLIPAQLISALGSIVIVTLGGILGREFARDPAWATLPLSLMVLGTALTTVPAALIMARIGRRRGFLSSALVGAGGVGIIAVSLTYKSFGLLCLGTAVYGTHLAFVQQYRFAAAESVAPKLAGRAISFVLLGSIGGAILGPLLVAYGRAAWPGVPYLGTMLAVVGLLGVAFLLLLGLVDAPVDAVRQQDAPARPLSVIARQPLYLLAMLCAAAGYGVMVFVMTATPLSMHVHDGYTIEQTASVVRSHVIAMYAPSLLAGFLMERFGVRRVMSVGALLLLATLGIGLVGHDLLHYQAALIALGVGWNFLYVGGTTLLTRTYTPAERFRAQGLNDLCVFAMSATASLLSGQVMGWFGWTAVMLSALPPLLLALIALTVLRKTRVPTLS